MFENTGIYGDSVNVASRIESVSSPGGIFISEKLFDEVKNNETISAGSLGYIIYEIHDKTVTVAVDVGHRKDIYQ